MIPKEIELYIDELRRDLKSERTRSAELSAKVHEYARIIDEISQERHDLQVRDELIAESKEGK